MKLEHVPVTSQIPKSFMQHNVKVGKFIYITLLLQDFFNKFKNSGNCGSGKEIVLQFPPSDSGKGKYEHVNKRDTSRRRYFAKIPESFSVFRGMSLCRIKTADVTGIESDKKLRLQLISGHVKTVCLLE